MVSVAQGLASVQIHPHCRNVNAGLGVVFIHNPRAAGTSIANALGLIDSHDTQRDIKRRFGEHWPSLFRFAFVRSPLGRFISAYEHRQQENPKNVMRPPLNGLRGKSIEEVTDLCLADHELFMAHLAPQTHFVSEPDELDFLGRFETLDADWKRLCHLLGVDIPLPHLNGYTPLRHREEYYTPFICAAVEHLYRDDFRTFGYQLPIPYLPEGTLSPHATGNDPIQTAPAQSPAAASKPCSGCGKVVPPRPPVETFEAMGGVIAPASLRI